MMKIFLRLLILLTYISVINANSQECIIVQNGEDMTIYYDSCLDDAFNDALDGSTIYISGGNFSFCDGATVVDKKLTIFGAGVYPVATTATNRTKINGNLKLRPGAEGTILTGLKFNELQATVDDITISRCNFTTLVPQAHINNWLIEESIFDGINSSAFKSSYFIIMKNFINTFHSTNTYSLRYVNSSQINNNAFLGDPYIRFDRLYDNIISNNIFSAHVGYFYYFCSDNFTFNCILTNFNSLSSSNNVDSNTLINQSAANHFVSYGSGNNTPFSFSNNYNLKDESAGKEYGTDGYDVGVYGTDDPFKDNALPFNPHIQEAVVANKSLNGGIKVKLKIEAQSK
ncbi:MAG: hypothetical protein M9949_12110 [Candidatus Kapabacteria bacterium]|nr:hypothetical protein [Candidatus Kapabacteria bacterium]